MIADMLKVENIQILEKVNDWKDAIHVSLEALIRKGYVEERYEQAILDSTKEYGPYYVLAEDFALIHGSPTDGVIEKQLAITLLREPIMFSEDSYPVRVLIALAASDAESHMDTMRVLTSIFLDEEKVQQLVHSETPEQIYSLLTDAEKQI